MTTADPRLREVVPYGPDGYTGRYRNLRFIVSAFDWEGQEWLHASVSRRDKATPTYDDLMLLKRLCIGEHRTAVHLFPPSEKHADVAGPMGTEVLHLWARLDQDLFDGIIPNFGKYGTI